MKQGKGKLIFYHDLEEEKLKSKIDERRELMIDQLFAD